MEMFQKKGFTLIELLAVIIILAVIALIATPIVLNVVDNAKESARQSSVSGYADATQLAVYDAMYLDNGKLPTIDKEWAKNNVKKQGSDIDCDEVIYSENYGVVLNKCNVLPDTKEYCFASGKTYLDCATQEYQDIYNKVNDEQQGESLISTLLLQYQESNTVGLLKENDNYYYKGIDTEVTNNFIWYEGHLWRILEINNDNTMTMITQQPVTAIQLANFPWITKEDYESSYINTWLNNVFYNSISNKSKIKKNTFNIGIYTNVSEITTNQYVGLLDEAQYIKAGLANSFLDIKDYFWLGNRYTTTDFRNINFNNGNINYNTPTIAGGVRPVITISDIIITNGDGSLQNPFRGSSKSKNTNDVKVGEYISVPGSNSYCGSDSRCLFRVVSKDNDSVKVILNGLLPMTNKFGNTASDVTFTLNTATTPIYASLLDFVNSISSTYRYIGTKTFNIGKYQDAQNYTAVSSQTILSNVGLPVIGELFSGNDIDVTKLSKKFVNIDTIENSNVSDFFWTMNPYSLENIRSISNYGHLLSYASTYEYGIRPTIYLNLGTNLDLTFTKGDGTAENPYWLGN